MRPEPNFSEYSKKIKNTKNISELLDVLTIDHDPRITRDELRAVFQKECNKKFKGNFLKYKNYSLAKCNEAEYYYYQELYNLP